MQIYLTRTGKRCKEQSFTAEQHIFKALYCFNPGFYLNPPLSNVIAGATLSTPYSLPPNLYLDESGFLAELQSSNHEQ